MKRLVLFALLLCSSFASAQVAPPAVPPIKDAKTVSGGRGYIPLTPEKRAYYQKISHDAHGGRIRMLAKNLAVPAAFDCRNNGWLLPTGDQADCGSCYLYSTIYGTTTSAFVRAGYGKPDGSFLLAVQYGMDCHNFGGCNGGNGTEVIDWLCKNGWPAEKYTGLDGVLHKDYPAYTARSGSCRSISGAKLWKPATWGFVNANGNPSIAEIKAAMFKYGPLNIALDAGGQFGNGTGTITSLGRSIDHEINCVGWDDNKDGGSFLLWNQWTDQWGIGGFRWITYSASKNIVDWFFVNADPLPPPPPPPPTVLVPVITSAGTIQVTVNVPFVYQITATNNPTGFSASGLPAGWTCSATGFITGTTAATGARSLVIAAANAAGTGTANLIVTTDPVPVPVPPTGAKITFSQDMKAGTYAMLDESDVAALSAIMSKINAKQVSVQEPPMTDEKVMLRLMNIIDKLNKRVVELEKQLAEPKSSAEPKEMSQLYSPVTKESVYVEVYPSIRLHDADRIARHLSRTHADGRYAAQSA